MSQTFTWKQLVANVLHDLGGEASLKDITARLKHNPHRPETATWQATIRRVVRQYSIFEPFTTAKGLAGYRLVHIPPQPGVIVGEEEDPHWEQQGIVLELGSLCGYGT